MLDCYLLSKIASVVAEILLHFKSSCFHYVLAIQDVTVLPLVSKTKLNVGQINTYQQRAPFS